MSKGYDFAFAIGGAAGQGIATPGNILARIFVRRGLRRYTPTTRISPSSRGGHIFLTVRVKNLDVVESHGDSLNLILCLNQDTMDRPRAPRGAGRGHHLQQRHRQARRGAGRRAALRHAHQRAHRRQQEQAGPEHRRARRHGEPARRGLQGPRRRADAAVQAKGPERRRRERPRWRARDSTTPRPSFQAFSPTGSPRDDKPLAVWTGNDALGMGGAAAGVKFYVGLSDEPVHGRAALDGEERPRARDHGAPDRGRDRRRERRHRHSASTGARSMCATSGGGFALMTEAFGSAAMMEMSGGVHQRDARRAVHGRADQDRAGRPVAGTWARARATSSASSSRRRTRSTRSTPWAKSSTSSTTTSARRSSSRICSSPRAPSASTRTRSTCTRRSTAARSSPRAATRTAISATRSPTAGSRPARCPARPDTPSWPPPTSTTKTACSSVTSTRTRTSGGPWWRSALAS